MTGSFIRTMHLLMHHVSCRVFWWNIKWPRWLHAPYSSDLTPCDFWLFLKLKSSLKGKRFQNIIEIQEKTMGKADGDWESCVRSQGAYFEGDWGIIVICTRFPASSSVNISTFDITWLDTFWTGLIHIKNCSQVTSLYQNMSSLQFVRISYQHIESVIHYFIK